MSTTTVIKQHREPTSDGEEKLVTTIRLGADPERPTHVVQTVEYSSNQGYYLRVNGQNVPLNNFPRRS